jgi:hypothetical protein
MHQSQPGKLLIWLLTIDKIKLRRTSGVDLPVGCRGVHNPPPPPHSGVRHPLEENSGIPHLSCELVNTT